MSHRTNTEARFGYLRQYPVDLAVVSLAAILSYLALTSFGIERSLRLLVTFPLALFLPGYALVSVLFPASEQTARTMTARAAGRRSRGIDSTERIGLAFALSLAIGPLLVIVVPFTPWNLETSVVAGGLAVITIVLAQIAVVRRLQTPEPKRFTVSPMASVKRIRGTESRAAMVSSVVLTLAIATAVSALLFAFVAPASTGGFTELALYSENENGELVAGEIPSEVAPNESIPVTVVIENQEGEAREYTVVVQQQVIDDGSVVERTELDRIDASIPAGSTGTGAQEITPTAEAGKTVRISVLLFNGEPPAEPTNKNADEDTYFWVTVTDSA